MTDQPINVAVPVQSYGLIWEGDRAPLAKALVSAQKAMESVKKASSNPAFKSKYADLSEVVEAVVPALNEQGVAVIQSPSFDGDWVSISTTMLHESGAAVSSVLRLRPSKSDPQGVGSAITYARRYSLLAMTGTAPEDDDGNAASGPRQQHQQQQQPKVQERAPLTLTERAEAVMAALASAPDPDTLAKVWAKASGLCADLDMKDPERLIQITALYEGLRDEMDANPFAKQAA